MKTNLNHVLKVFKMLNELYGIFDLSLQVQKNYIMIVDVSRPNCYLSLGFLRGDVLLKDFANLLVSVDQWWRIHQNCSEKVCWEREK